MTNRERAMNILHYKPVDRMPAVHFGYWGELLTEWAEQGKIPKELAEGNWDSSPKDRELDKQREASAHGVIALLLIQLLYLLSHFLLCGFVVSARVLFADSRFLGAQTSLLDRIFLLSYTEDERHYQLCENSEEQYRENIAVSADITEELQYIAYRDSNKIHYLIFLLSDFDGVVIVLLCRLYFCCLYPFGISVSAWEPFSRARDRIRPPSRDCSAKCAILTAKRRRKSHVS